MTKKMIIIFATLFLMLGFFVQVVPFIYDKFDFGYKTKYISGHELFQHPVFVFYRLLAFVSGIIYGLLVAHECRQKKKIKSL